MDCLRRSYYPPDIEQEYSSALRVVHSRYRKNLIFSSGETLEEKPEMNFLYVKANHLGNVRAVVGGRKKTGNLPDIFLLADQYAFGMPMPSRQYLAEEYRFGFNGQEKDNEMKGSGNSIDFGARMYDSRLGRLFSSDIYGQFMSSYQGLGNTPISAVDVSGDYVFIVGDDGNMILSNVTNAVYSTSWGKEVLSKYIDDPNNHIFIGNTTEIIRKETIESGEKNVLGITVYNFDIKRNEIAPPIVGFPPKTPLGNVFNFINVTNLPGKISVVLLHQSEVNAKKVEAALHEIGAHIYFRDFINKDMNNDGVIDTDDEHIWYGEYGVFSQSPSSVSYKELQRNVDLNDIFKSLIFKQLQVPAYSPNISVLIDAASNSAVQRPVDNAIFSLPGSGGGSTPAPPSTPTPPPSGGNGGPRFQ